MSTEPPLLVADIGGTNARFALAKFGGGHPVLEHLHTLPARDHASLVDTVAAYLDTCPQRPTAAVLAVAGPVTDGAVTFINSPWQVSEADLAKLGLKPARLLNDFQALAWALPQLPPNACAHLAGPSRGLDGATLAVLGPGTGFGVSALVRNGPNAAATLATEGGHGSFAPTDAVEDDIARILRRRFGRASIERLLCGPGLINLHSALAEIDGRPDPQIDDPADITRRALAEPDSVEAETLSRFCSILGSVAGDIALTIGARGGVHVAGGIAPRILEFLRASPFRERFEAKGRYRAYMEAIPTCVITHPHPALLGAAILAARE